MDAVDHIAYAGLTGHSFGLAEQAAIRAGTVVLLSHTKHQSAEVWGKVIAQQADYIVIACYSDCPLNAVHFFSTNGGIEYHLLPPPTTATPPKASDSEQPEGHGAKNQAHVSVVQLCKKIQGSYVGDPAYEYRVADPITGVIYCIRESERLSCFVKEHGERCRVVPRGAFALREKPLSAQASETNATISVARNTTFEGLDRAAAGRLTSYFHLRPTSRDRSLLEKENTANAVDFLDTIADDVPAGIWNLRYDPVLDVIYGTSNAYFGTVFFHQPQSKTIYGNVYIGDGSANQDLAFML